MPIPKDKQKLYPKNWKAIREEILTRANHRCECFGECGIDHRAEDTGNIISPRCLEINGCLALMFKGKVVLTIAHLNHNPKDSRRRNLMALCQRCHNRYDSKHRQANASKTRDRKRGQGRLF